MGEFLQRHKLYQLGAAILCLALLLTIWGVIAPGWLTQDISLPVQVGNVTVLVNLTVNAGLFFDCQNDYFDFDCQDRDLAAADDSDKALVATAVIGLILTFVAVVMVILVNLMNDVMSHNYIVDGVTLMGGISLFSTCMIFVGNYIDQVGEEGTNYGPSFVVSLVASLLTSLAAAMMALFRRRAGTYARFGQKSDDETVRFTSHVPRKDQSEAERQLSSSGRMNPGYGSGSVHSNADKRM